MNFTEAIVLAVEKVKAWIQSGGVKWDHVSEKPFVKQGGDTLTWDGNTEGLVSVDMGLGFQSYNVSNAVVSMADLANGCNITHSIFGEIALTASDITDTGAGFFFENNGYVIFVTEDAVGVDLDGLMFSKQGVYLANSDAEGHVSSLTIPNYTGFAKEQIDPKVLPEALQFGDKLVEIMPETEITATLQDGMYAVPLDPSLFSGDEDTLYISFDGVEYVCNANNLNGYPIFGNAKYDGGEDTGEPFCLLASLLYGMVLLAVEDGEPHMVGIKTIAADKINPRYIESVATFYANISYDADGAKYLYTDAALSNKATAADLSKTAKNQSVRVLFVHEGFTVADCAPLIFSYGEFVAVTMIDPDQPGEFIQRYTAEYTA